MITVSTAVATALEQPSRQIDVKLFNETALDVDVMSLKMYKGACGQFTVGSVFVPYLEMTLNGDVDIDEFEVRVSVAVNGVFSTYYTVGWFKATSIEKKTEQTEVYAQGKLAFATEKINPSGRTLQNILSAVREHYTVDIKNLTIPSASIPELIPITDFTCRDALELIAVCSGGYVSETYNGHLVLGGFKNSTVAGTITEDRLTEQPIIKGEYELTGIDVKVSEAMTYHIPTEQAVKNFEITNPYFNGDMAQTFSSNTIGHSFNVANVKVAMGDFRYEPFDLIEVVKGDLGLLPSDTLYPSDNLFPSEGASETFTVPCYNITLTFDGGLQSEFNAEGELPTEKETKTGGAISSKLNEAYEKAIAANNLASQASQDAQEALEAVEDIEETGLDTTYTRTQYAMGTYSAPTGTWSYDIPNLTSAYPYLWIRYVTVKRDKDTGVETIQGDPWGQTKSTLLSGAYTFIADNYDPIGAASTAVESLEDALYYGTTTINGGCITTGYINANLINLNYAMYTGSHSTLNSPNLGLYMGTDGISYCMNGYDGWGQYKVTIASTGNHKISNMAIESGTPVDSIFSVEMGTTALFAVVPDYDAVAVNTLCASDDITCHGSIGGQSLTITGLSYFYSSIYPYKVKITDAGTSSSATANCRLTEEGWVDYVKGGSSKLFKHDIKAVENEELNPDRLYGLDVIQFKYNKDYLSEDDDRQGKDLIGFIAEDLETIYPTAVAYTESGKVEGWNEKIIIPAMLKLIQAQHNDIENLKSQIQELRGA